MTGRIKKIKNILIIVQSVRINDDLFKIYWQATADIN
jgi:hypothetical protein